MAKIQDCNGKKLVISKGSITIKNDKNGKTEGVVRGISSLPNLQLNRQFEYSSALRKLGLWGAIKVKNVIIADGKMYYFRNVKDRKIYENLYSDDASMMENLDQEESICRQLKDAGIDVIEYIPA